MQVLKSVGIHDGPFHGDEVTACALLILFGLVDLDKIFRSRDPQILKKCEYLCDVGGIYDPLKKRFDHHQADYQGSLCSAGMVLLFLKEQKLLRPELYHYFNETLVLGVDAYDIGEVKLEKGVATFSQVVETFLPIEYEATESEIEIKFQEALSFVLGHLDRLKMRFEYFETTREIVRTTMQSKEKVLIFAKALAWQENFFALGGEDHPAEFIIMPSKNQWKLRGIPPTLERKWEVRKPLPKSWAGLEGEALQRKTHIPGAIFCHKGQFISFWKTKEDALKAVELVYQEKNL